MLSAIYKRYMLSVVMLSAIMLNVVAPSEVRIDEEPNRLILLSVFTM
jgi:hypothetical protein